LVACSLSASSFGGAKSTLMKALSAFTLGMTASAWMAMAGKSSGFFAFTRSSSRISVWRRRAASVYATLI
jgi:hypothetical protein